MTWLGRVVALLRLPVTPEFDVEDYIDQWGTERAHQFVEECLQAGTLTYDAALGYHARITYLAGWRLGTSDQDLP